MMGLANSKWLYSTLFILHSLKSSFVIMCEVIIKDMNVIPFDVLVLMRDSNIIAPGEHGYV